MAAQLTATNIRTIHQEMGYAIVADGNRGENLPAFRASLDADQIGNARIP